ncbi:MAG: SpoIIE family protein phosphatase [Bryobacterales bacterium]|nr:SpoIIE family protein phosphatase [Bryobacterales bacterium]
MENAGHPSLRFRERAELLDFFLEIAAVTSETLDLDRLLAGVAGITTRVIPCELFAILLYSERRRRLRIHYAIGHRREVVEKLEVALGEGLSGLAAIERRPILSGDVQNDPRYLRVVDAVQTELAVPMLSRGGKLVGVIDMQSTTPHAYTAYEQSTLQLIASRVAAAIDHARLHRRIERQNRTLRALTRLSQEFSSILDLDTLLTKIAGAVRSLVLFDSFSIMLLDEQRGVLRHRFSSRYDERVTGDNFPLDQGITGAAARQREAIRVDDALADPRYIPLHPDIRSEVAVPLVIRDKVIGVMDLESERIGFFTEDHVRVLSLLAPQIAISIENARLYQELAERKKGMEADLAAARELQSVLLPRQAPEVPGLEIASGVRPAHEISGDLYDFFPQGRERTVVAVGDVSGKGAAAALYAALVSGLLRIMAPARARPSQLMKSLNTALLERKVDARFVTLLVLEWRHRKRQLRMANAGAMPPLIVRAGEVQAPRVEGVPLGLLEDREYDELSFQAQPGDLIVLYSDGVEDQRNSAGGHYGRGRLKGLIELHWQAAPQTLVDAVFEDLNRFSDGARTSDDQTLIVMKVK